MRCVRARVQVNGGKRRGVCGRAGGGGAVVKFMLIMCSDQNSVTAVTRAPLSCVKSRSRGALLPRDTKDSNPAAAEPPSAGHQMHPSQEHVPFLNRPCCCLESAQLTSLMHGRQTDSQGEAGPQNLAGRPPPHGLILPIILHRDLRGCVLEYCRVQQKC